MQSNRKTNSSARISTKTVKTRATPLAGAIKAANISLARVEFRETFATKRIESLSLKIEAIRKGMGKNAPLIATLRTNIANLVKMEQQLIAIEKQSIVL